MLEQIFGSKAREQIITLFVRNPDKGFYVREIARITGQYINSTRRELANLTRFGLLKSKSQLRKRFYYMDQSFFLYEEIKSLFIKSKVFLENDLTNALKQIGDIKLLLFSGAFTGALTPTDLLLVGDALGTNKLRSVLENFSFTIGQEIKYTLFDVGEYRYRKEINDHFLNTIESQKHIVLIDKL